MSSADTSPDRGELDELFERMDMQMCVLGRFFSAKHGMSMEAPTLRMPQYLLLIALTHAGPMKMADAATSLGMKPPAFSALVDAGVEAGLVRREQDEHDRRVTRIAITDEGRAALQLAEVDRREHMRRYLSVLSADDLRELIRIQQILIDSFAEKP